MKNRGPLLKVKSKFQNQIIWMVFTAMAIPTLIFGGSMYLMIAKLSGPNSVTSPQEVVVDVTRYIAIFFPVLVALLLWWAFHGTNKLVGPIDRMIRELDERIQGSKSGPIVLRPGDQLIPLAEKINIVLQQRDESKERQNAA